MSPKPASDNTPLRVALIDDHAHMIVDRLRSQFNGRTDIELGAIGESGEDFLRIASTVPADIILLDLQLPPTAENKKSKSFSTITAVKRVLGENPSLKIVIVSGETEHYMITEALRVGCRGYVVKADDVDFAAIVHTILSGETYVSKTAQDALAETAEDQFTNRPLSERELDVLWYLAQPNLRSEDIARLLTISPNTVNRHADAVYKKLGVNQRAAAVALAQRMTLLRAPSNN